MNKDLISDFWEFGYEPAAIGFSFSFNTTIERAKELMPKYAWGKFQSERKFLRTMQTWSVIDLPRLQWQEADQYKVASTTLSESTVHTIKRRLLTPEDFIEETDQRAIDIVNEYILLYREKKCTLLKLKANIPEGFLQKRLWNINYATIQNYMRERWGHPVTLWDKLIIEMLPKLQFPDFVFSQEKQVV